MQIGAAGLGVIPHRRAAPARGGHRRGNLPVAAGDLVPHRHDRPRLAEAIICRQARLVAGRQPRRVLCDGVGAAGGGPDGHLAEEAVEIRLARGRVGRRRPDDQRDARAGRQREVGQLPPARRLAVHIQLQLGPVPRGGGMMPALDDAGGLAGDGLGQPLRAAEAEGDLAPRGQVHVEEALVDRRLVVGRLRQQRQLPRRQRQGLEAEFDGELLEPGGRHQRRRPDPAAVAEAKPVVITRRRRSRQERDKTPCRQNNPRLHTPHLTPAAGRCHAGGAEAV